MPLVDHCCGHNPGIILSMPRDVTATLRRSGTRRWNFRVPEFYTNWSDWAKIYAIRIMISVMSIMATCPIILTVEIFYLQLLVQKPSHFALHLTHRKVVPHRIINRLSLLCIRPKTLRSGYTPGRAYQITGIMTVR